MGWLIGSLETQKFLLSFSIPLLLIYILSICPEGNEITIQYQFFQQLTLLTFSNDLIVHIDIFICDNPQLSLCYPSSIQPSGHNKLCFKCQLCFNYDLRGKWIFIHPFCRVSFRMIWKLWMWQHSSFFSVPNPLHGDVCRTVHAQTVHYFYWAERNCPDQLLLATFIYIYRRKICSY